MTESTMRAREFSVLKLFCAFWVLIALGLFLPVLPAHADSFYTATLAQAAQAPGMLLKAQPISLPLLYRAKAWRILYSTRDYAGRSLVSSGIVVASTVQAATKRPQNIIAWAHPTVGTAPACAPSLRQTPLQSILGVKELIGAGKIIVETDYPGLGTPGPIGYLIGKGQAYAVLDSVRATAHLPGLKVSRNYAIYGFSQGGHAALFAAREAPGYMPEFALKGAAAIAPPTDLLRLFSYNVSTIEGKILLSYTLQSWAIKYGLSLRDVLSDSAIATAWAINKTCVDDLGGSVDAFKLQQQFKADMFAANPLQHSEWLRYLFENSLAVFPKTAPLLIVQGGSDTIVRPEVTQAVLSSSCLNGSNIKFSLLANMSHSGSATAAFPAVTDWLVARLAGKANENSCTSALVARMGDDNRR